VLQFEPAAAQAAEIRATLERRGSPIGPHDTLIAGRARSRGLMVIAGDLGEFSRVDGLRSEDWLSSPPTR
jgi:tRNA(fMet)-specific endonuclease VapC